MLDLIHWILDEGTKSWWLGSALMIEKCASLFGTAQARQILLFLMIRGLSHEDDQVREKMVSAGTSQNHSFSEILFSRSLSGGQLRSRRGRFFIPIDR